MPQRTQSLHDKPLIERTPLDNDLDPDGMDSETEGEDDLRDGADGVVERRSARQSRTRGTHGAADPHTTPPRKRH